MSSSLLNGIYHTDAIVEALKQTGELFSNLASNPTRLTLDAVVPLDAQSDIDHVIPTMTRICGSVHMAFHGVLSGVTQVMFTERMALFFHDALVDERWRPHHNRFAEMDAVLEAGQGLLACFWASLLGADASGLTLSFDSPVIQWGSVESQLEGAFRQAVARAYVISCDCGGEYVDELILVQAATPAEGAPEMDRGER
ncbi:MAG: hypothetical protein PHG65_01955 [Kiritimatiellae bacterium]|nr:hypothetical protein [Kiritimatiellia bacterium]